MTEPRPIPDTYRLLDTFSGEPLDPAAALIAAGLRSKILNPTDPRDPGRAPITDAHRALLRELHVHRRCIDWRGTGYVLTPTGTQLLNDYFDRYGPLHTPRRAPPLSETARAHLAPASAPTPPAPTNPQDVPQ